MLDTCRAILLAALQPLGLKQIVTEEKDAGAIKVKPYAVLEWGDEELTRSRRRLRHTDNLAAGTRTIHQQVATRSIWFRIRLVADTPAKVDQLVTQLITNLPSRVSDPQLGSITLALSGAETPDSIGVVAREARWEGQVQFQAPVIGTRTVPLINLATDLVVETDPLT